MSVCVYVVNCGRVCLCVCVCVRLCVCAFVRGCVYVSTPKIIKGVHVNEALITNCSTFWFLYTTRAIVIVDKCGVSKIICHEFLPED